jgi:hypothetical protein
MLQVGGKLASHFGATNLLAFLFFNSYHGVDERLVAGIDDRKSLVEGSDATPLFVG